MKTSRRDFITQSVAIAGVLSSINLPQLTNAQEPLPKQQSPTRMHLGLVTYNLAKDWDIPTIIKNCEETGFEGVELRTTHAHGVEVTLTKSQRADVKKRFSDSNVKLVSLGSVFDYHTPDQQKLRKDIEATKDYIILAHDVGAQAIKVRPNALPKEVPPEKTLEQIGKSLFELGEFSKNYNIEIRLEVHGEETSRLINISKIMNYANHKYVGVCWNSNLTDLQDGGFESNFELVKNKIRIVHITELYQDAYGIYPYRKLFDNLKKIGFDGFCLAEIPSSPEPIRLMKYYRALWLALTS